MLDNIIASFPRSGNHLVRYIIEYLSGRPTLGEGNKKWANTVDGPVLNRLSLIQKNIPFEYINNDPIAVKRHFAREKEVWKNTLYIHRNPMEAILRHSLHNKSLEYILDIRNISHLQNLSKQYFDLQCKVYSSETLLVISFENLVFKNDRLGETITKISKFFNFEVTIPNIRLFIKDWDRHKNQAREVYINTCKFYECATFPFYWSEKLSSEQLAYVGKVIYANK